MGGKPRQSNDDALRALRESLPASSTPKQPDTSRNKTHRRFATIELRGHAADGGWHWVERDGSLSGVLDAEHLDGLGELRECDTLRIQVEVSRTEFSVIQVVPNTHRTFDDKQRRERIREI
ncbi:MAG: hypothetical protein ACKOYL_09410, partial [Actinomycetota bacterium]